MGWGHLIRLGRSRKKWSKWTFFSVVIITHLYISLTLRFLTREFSHVLLAGWKMLPTQEFMREVMLVVSEKTLTAQEHFPLLFLDQLATFRTGLDTEKGPVKGSEGEKGR